MPFSKKLLLFDYAVTVILLTIFFICIARNGAYTIQASQELTETGTYSVLPYDISAIGIVIGAWTAQLGVSSTAYYVLCKSEHKIQLPMRLINEMPKNIQETVDMTAIITAVLSTTDN